MQSFLIKIAIRSLGHFLIAPGFISFSSILSSCDLTHWPHDFLKMLLSMIFLQHSISANSLAKSDFSFFFFLKHSFLTFKSKFPFLISFFHLLNPPTPKQLMNPLLAFMRNSSLSYSPLACLYHVA